MRGGDVGGNCIVTIGSDVGILNRDTAYTGKIRSDSGESGNLSGQVVGGTGLTISVGTGATSGQGSIKSLKVSNTFTPPFGGINDRPSAPQSGALFYNKDFRTIEYWDGNFWRQVDNTTKRGRAVFMGGYVVPANVPDIDFVEMASKGNAVYFGDIFARGWGGGACANGTRAIYAGGHQGASPYPTVTDMYEYSFTHQGYQGDFGNLTTLSRSVGNMSSSTRAVWPMGTDEESPTAINVIDYSSMHTKGNAVDFGDCTTAGAEDGKITPGGNASSNCHGGL